MHIPIALHKKIMGILYTAEFEVGHHVYTPQLDPCSESGQTAFVYPLQPCSPHQGWIDRKNLFDARRPVVAVQHTQACGFGADSDTENWYSELPRPCLAKGRRSSLSLRGDAAPDAAGACSNPNLNRWRRGGLEWGGGVGSKGYHHQYFHWGWVVDNNLFGRHIQGDRTS